MELGSKMIIIEGIMGSGKSTTVRFLAEHLSKCGVDATFIGEEVDPHPLRVDDTLPHPYQPWLDVTPAEYIALSRQAWGRYVEERQREKSVLLLDGQLFHGDLTNLLMMNATDDQLREQVQQIVDVTRSLRPTLIYLVQADVERALDNIVAIRGQGWRDYQINWKTASPYCHDRGYAGRRGWVQLYQDYRSLCDNLFEGVEIEKCRVDVTEGHWQEYQDTMCAVLGVPGPGEAA